MAEIITKDSFSFGAIHRALDASGILHTPPQFSEEEQARALMAAFRDRQKAQESDLCPCCGQVIRRVP